MKEKIQVFQAINTLASFLEKEPGDVANKIAFFLSEEEKTKLFGAYNDSVVFYRQPWEERARQMGYMVEEKGDTVEVSTVL